MSNPEWLVVAPCFDSVTEYTLDEAKDIISYFEEKKVTYIKLLVEDAIREKVEDCLKRFPKMSIYHADHGSEDAIWGNDERPVIDLKNVDLLKDRECYNNNCSSAKKLGVEAWKRSATYWGYTNLFIFTTDAAEEFKEAVNSGLKCRVDGNSKKNCLQYMKDKMTELANFLVDTGRAMAGACMRRDRDILVCYDTEAPESDCLLRKLAVKLFGKAGWYLSKFWTVIFCIGFGISLHDFCHALWQVGGYTEILSPQGGYIGFIMMLSAFIGAIISVARKLLK